MEKKAIKTKARNVLKNAGILRQDENYHTLLDVSRLRSIPDDELKKMRNVGGTTVEFINKFRKLFEWL